MNATTNTPPDTIVVHAGRAQAEIQTYRLALLQIRMALTTSKMTHRALGVDMTPMEVVVLDIANEALDAHP